MSNDNNELPSFLESPEVPVSLGQALQEARIAASLSVAEAAKKLNLGVATLHDLENNLDNVLETQKYPVIYLRGYLVNYAKLVTLNDLSLYPEYKLLNSVQKQKQTLKSSSLIIPRAKKRSKKWSIFWLLLITLVACGFYFQATLLKTIGLNIKMPQPISGLTSETEFKQDLAKKILMQSSQSQATESDDDLPQNEIINGPETNEQIIDDGIINLDNSEVLQNSEQVLLNVVDEVVDNNEQSFDTIKASITQTIPADTDTLAIDELVNVEGADDIINDQIEPLIEGAPENISLLFSGDCWTEVFDATGERIAFGLYSKGRSLMLSGIAPFKLKLGDPSAVEIQYQDKIIEGGFTPGRSAQFSVPLS